MDPDSPSSYIHRNSSTALLQSKSSFERGVNRMLSKTFSSKSEHPSTTAHRLTHYLAMHFNHCNVTVPQHQKHVTPLVIDSFSGIYAPVKAKRKSKSNSFPLQPLHWGEYCISWYDGWGEPDRWLQSLPWAGRGWEVCHCGAKSRHYSVSPCTKSFSHWQHKRASDHNHREVQVVQVLVAAKRSLASFHVRSSTIPLKTWLWMILVSSSLLSESGVLTEVHARLEKCFQHVLGHKKWCHGLSISLCASGHFSTPKCPLSTDAMNKHLFFFCRLFWHFGRVNVVSLSFLLMDESLKNGRITGDIWHKTMLRTKHPPPF